MNDETASVDPGGALARGGLLVFIGADVALTAMSLLAGFAPGLIGPTVVVALLSFLAYRGMRWARLLLVVLALLRMMLVMSWFVGALVGLQVIGMMITFGLGAAYGFAAYVLGLSKGGMAFFERRQTERLEMRGMAGV